MYALLSPMLLSKFTFLGSNYSTAEGFRFPISLVVLISEKIWINCLCIYMFSFGALPSVRILRKLFTISLLTYCGTQFSFIAV